MDVKAFAFVRKNVSSGNWDAKPFHVFKIILMRISIPNQGARSERRTRFFLKLITVKDLRKNDEIYFISNMCGSAKEQQSLFCASAWRGAGLFRPWLRRQPGPFCGLPTEWGPTSRPPQQEKIKQRLAHYPVVKASAHCDVDEAYEKISRLCETAEKVITFQMERPNLKKILFPCLCENKKQCREKYYR